MGSSAFPMVHAALGVRTQPLSFGGRADSQDPMDQIPRVADVDEDIMKITEKSAGRD
jgi:hypothetical protein